MKNGLRKVSKIDTPVPLISQLQIRDFISVHFHFIPVGTGVSIYMKIKSSRESLPIKPETITGENPQHSQYPKIRVLELVHKFNI